MVAAASHSFVVLNGPKRRQHRPDIEPDDFPEPDQDGVATSGSLLCAVRRADESKITVLIY
jgi:hypothetical protein